MWDFKCKVTKKWLNFEFSDLVCYGSFSQQRPWLSDWFLLLANLVGNFPPRSYNLHVCFPTEIIPSWAKSLDVRSPQMISKDIASRNPPSPLVLTLEDFPKKLRGVRMLTSLLSLITLRPWQVRFVIKCREAVEGQPREDFFLMAGQPPPTRNVPTPEIRPF